MSENPSLISNLHLTAEKLPPDLVCIRPPFRYNEFQQPRVEAKSTGGLSL